MIFPGKEKSEPVRRRKKVISYHAVYNHFRKWSRDGSLEKLWQASILTIQGALNLSELNFDGSHVIAKKGGESVAYQGRKRAKTTNLLPLTDVEGYIVASTLPVAGNHNDAFRTQSPATARLQSAEAARP